MCVVFFHYAFLTAKERDTESGLDYFLARYYSGAQGRFTSPDEFTGGPDDVFTLADTGDPLFYANTVNPQSLNKYQYCYNNPFRYVDPDGHAPGAAEVVEVTMEEVDHVVKPLIESAGTVRGGGILLKGGLRAGGALVGVLLDVQTVGDPNEDAKMKDFNTRAHQSLEAQKQKQQQQEEAKSKGNPPGIPKDARKLKGDQGWKDKDGNTWKKDQKHKDHYDVSDRKRNKIKEVDFNGNQIWPDGKKNKNKTA